MYAQGGEEKPVNNNEKQFESQFRCFLRQQQQPTVMFFMHSKIYSTFRRNETKSLYRLALTRRCMIFCSILNVLLYFILGIGTI